MACTKETVKPSGLNVWSSEAADGPAPAVDIIAVQGLGSHEFYTWVKKVPSADTARSKRFWVKAQSWKSKKQQGKGEEDDSTEVMWLRDLLVPMFKDARIATYSYKSDWKDRTINTSLRQCAEQFLNILSQHRQRADEKKRPLVLIGHSLGSLVIQQALVIAVHQRDFADLRFSVAGIIFLGAPFQGSDVASIGTRLAQLSGLDSTILKLLEKDSPSLYALLRDFWHSYSDWDLVCFYEDLESKYGPIKKQMVSPQSASLLGKQMMFLNTDHSGLNKFSGEDDENFRLVLPEIRRMVERGPSNVTERHLNNGRTAQRRYTYQVEYSQSNHFISRPSLTSAILRQLDGSKPRRCVLYGMAGIGKTALSLDITEQFQNHSHVLWINCSDTAAMRAHFRAIGITLGQSSTMSSETEVKRLLTERDDWLLIFDNIDEDATFVCFKKELLPTGSNGRVLVTGRFVSLTTWGFTIHVPLLSDDEGVELLAKFCPSAQHSRHHSEILVGELGELPLAIELAAVYMLHSSTSVEEYTTKFRSEQNRTSLLGEKPTSEYSKQLKDTWTLSFNHIAEDEKLLFNLLALLRPDGVEEQFLRKGSISNPSPPSFPISRIIGFERGVSLPSRYAEVLDAEERFRNAVTGLLCYSLIRRTDQQRLFIHPVLRLLSFEQIQQPVRQEIAKVSLYLATNNMASFGDMDFVTNSGYLHDAKMAVSNPSLGLQMPTTASNDFNAAAKIYFYLGRAYWLMREYKSAKNFYKKAEGFSEKAFKMPYPWTLWIYYNL